MFKKGDTIKLKDGSVGLVLNDGIKGINFVEQYEGQQVLYLITRHPDQQIELTKFTVDCTCEWAVVGISPNTSLRSQSQKIEEVWYEVLIGNNKGWIEKDKLVLWKTPA